MTDKVTAWFQTVDLKEEEKQRNQMVADQIWNDINKRRCGRSNEPPSEYERMKEMGSFYTSIFD